MSEGRLYIINHNTKLSAHKNSEKKTCALFNESGSATAMVILLSVAILVVLGILGNWIISSINMQRQQDIQQEKLSLQNSIQTVLSHSTLCDAKLKIRTGNTIEFENMFAIGDQFERYIQIDDMRLNDIQNLGGNRRSARLFLQMSCTGRFSSSCSGSIEEKIMYEDIGGGNVSSCGRAATREVCEGYNGVWDPQTETCDLCAALGGTMVNGVCVVP